MKLKSIACLLLVSAMPAMAAAVISLPGNSKTSTWTNLSSVQYTPTATSSAPWGPIPADAGSGSSVTFAKTSGPAYFPTSGAGIYGYHTAGSTYSIVENSPIDSLENLVLQGRFNLREVSITLSYNGGSQNLVANYTSATPVEALISDFAWQWDLSGVTDEITSYTVTINAQSSTYLYASSPLSINTSDSFVQVIPEPASGLLALGSLALALTRRRRA